LDPVAIVHNDCMNQTNSKETQRTMKRQTLPHHLLPLGLGLLLGPLPVGQAQQPSALKIFTAIEVEFDTVPGQVYLLQGSSNLVDWVNIGQPVFALGNKVTQVFSTRSGGEVSYGNYRLQIQTAPTNDLAPWTLAGLTLQLDDTPGHDLLRFLTDTTGEESGPSPDPFTYTFSRPGLNQVRLELVFADQETQVLTLSFTSPGLGTWAREEIRNGQVTDRDTGTFHVVSGGSPGNPGGGDGGTTPGADLPVPTTLTGLAYAFQAGDDPERLEFTTATEGVEYEEHKPGHDNHRFTYEYTLTGTNTARLVVGFKVGKWHEYELTFASGAQGTFVRREFKNNVLKDVDRGGFSAVELQPGNSVPGNDQSGDGTGQGSDDASGQDGNGDDQSGQNPDHHGDSHSGHDNVPGSDDASGQDGDGDDQSGQNPDHHGDSHSGHDDVPGSDDASGHGNGASNDDQVPGNNSIPANATPVAPPNTLVGYALTEPQHPAESWQFADDRQVTKREGTKVRTYPYTYQTVGTQSAVLTVTKSIREQDTYTLTFLANGAVSYLKREYHDGLVDEEEFGTWLLARLAP
jgi:hypothetical protein